MLSQHQSGLLWLWESYSVWVFFCLFQVLLVDGNGLLHQRGFGVACHLGVLTDLPCVGVAKNLLHVDGLVKDELHKEQVKPDSFPAEERRYFPSDRHFGGCPWYGPAKL